MPSAHVVVIGGGLAGLAASIALAENGISVSLVEKHPRLGGRATSYLLPSGEYIDNCQHVTLRCCTNLEDFYRRIGVSEHIKYYDRLMFANSKGLRAEIKSSRLPAPLHVATSFAGFPLLNWQDKRSIALAMFRIMRAGGRPEFTAETTMLAWLKQSRQTEHAIDHFWRVVLVSALNEELDRIDAAHGIAVFWKAFLSNRDAFGVGIPAVPLEVLYASVADRIKGADGEVRIQCGVSELCMSNGEVCALRLDDGSLLKGDYYVAATPFDRLLKILPEPLAEIETFANIARLNVSPITSVHVWLDRFVMKEPFLASIDQTIQWVFNKTNLNSSGSAGQYLQVVISASRSLAQQSQQDIITMCRKELGDLIPGSAGAKWIRAIVIRENAATFSPEPGSDRWRPAARTPIHNFFLAGDWTQTGWPATMEGAVRSGYGAAEAILASEGRLVHLVRPELPVSRFASLLKVTRRN
jgi:squalene-associated FAD-dependent desaturase